MLSVAMVALGMWTWSLAQELTHAMGTAKKQNKTKWNQPNYPIGVEGEKKSCIVVMHWNTAQQ